MNTSSQSKKAGKKRRPRISRASSIRLVAAFDLLESLRSRKAVVLLALYGLGSIGASAIFIRILSPFASASKSRSGKPWT